MSETDVKEAEARKADRREAMAPSTLRSDGLAPRDVTVVDVSATGVRIVTEARLAVGQEISIGLAGAGTTRAIVAWARGDHYGCAFPKPLAPEDEARAFADSRPVRLGRAVETIPADGADGLEELYRGHRIWAIRADAIVAALAMLAAAAGAAWMMLGR